MKLELSYPAKPYIVNQGWGISNPGLYSAFGFTRHNGVDFQFSRDKRVRAEIPCFHYKSGFQPNGGGIYASYLSTMRYEREDGLIAYVLIDYLHLEKILTVEGQNLETGFPLAIPDNTGAASTGPHTHGQYRWVNWNENKTQLMDCDINDANGSFDPTPYYDGLFAEDIFKVGVLAKIRDLYLRILQLLSK